LCLYCLYFWSPELNLFHDRVKISQGGSQALLQLSGGDMRRVLNLLQATHLSYEEVTEEVVYLTAGAAVPRVIEFMCTALMNEPFKGAYDCILQVGKLYIIEINHLLLLPIIRE
jgi:replication factor C subunit 3/5